MWLHRSKLILIAAILTGCSAPVPVSVDKAFKVCGPDETENCRRIGPTAPITIRGAHE
jgi:hypothetical protein